MQKEEKKLQIYENVIKVNDLDQKLSAIFDKTDVTLILNGRPVLSGNSLWVEDMLVKLNKFVKECIKDLGK